ncbi:MAG TPA: rhodanese-like domain-containing protein [Oculatellaceae cyanobacterium]|jgi:rhodanese-related sulfurtransferase
MSPTQQAKTWQDFVREAKSRIKEITQDTLRQWMAEGKDMVILDVREGHDHALSRIEGAINIPRGVVELEIEESVPDKTKTIVAYCGGGGRSAMVADVLQQMGYTDVYSLQGGYKQWKEKPYPSTEYER